MENDPFKYKTFEMLSVLFIATFCIGMFLKFMFF